MYSLSSAMTRMSRILFLSERFPPDIGGLAASSSRIAGRLAELGHDVDVLAWSRHVPAAKLVDQEYPATEGSEGNARPQRVRRLGLYRQWDMSMPVTMNVLEWLHQERNYNLIWGHYLAQAGFLSTWFARSKGIINIVSARGNDIDTEIFPPGDFARLQWTLQNASVVSAVSKRMAEKIRILSHREDVFVLHNAVDSDLFKCNAELQTDKLRQQLGIAPDELVLGFTGELREKKGIQFLFDAFRQVRAHRPCCLLIIGDVRSQQKPATQLFSAEYPEDAARMIITGHINEPDRVAQFLQLCDLFLLPSLMEGMPNSLLEAMSCSRLCIASDAGGIPEIIKDGENGFILPCALLDRLGTAILELMELSEVEQQSIKSAARKSIEERFTPAQEKNHLSELLRRAFSNSSYDSVNNGVVHSRS